MSSKSWSFLSLCLFLQCWFTHLFYCNVLRRWHWDRGFIAHFRCPRLSEKVAKIAKVFYSECSTLTLQLWGPLAKFQLTLFCLRSTSELSRGPMFILLSALWVFEKTKTLSVNDTQAKFQIPGKPNYENDMRLIWPPAFLLWSEIQRSLSWRSNRLKSALGQAPSSTV